MGEIATSTAPEEEFACGNEVPAFELNRTYTQAVAEWELFYLTLFLRIINVAMYTVMIAKGIATNLYSGSKYQSTTIIAVLKVA